MRVGHPTPSCLRKISLARAHTQPSSQIFSNIFQEAETTFLRRKTDTTPVRGRWQLSSDHVGTVQEARDHDWRGGSSPASGSGLMEHNFQCTGMQRVTGAKVVNLAITWKQGSSSDGAGGGKLSITVIHPERPKLAQAVGLIDVYHNLSAGTSYASQIKRQA